MPDMDSVKQSKDYYLDIPQKMAAFFLKGSGSLGWGMENRLARIFNPTSGRTVMLAIDHGYFQGPTTGLERIDQTILPIVKYADSLMLTRGILRSLIPSYQNTPMVLRATGGISMMSAELSNEQLAMDIEEAIRLNASAVAIQVYIGAKYESQTIINMTKMIDMAMRYGIPVLGVNGVSLIGHGSSSPKALRSTGSAEGVRVLSRMSTWPKSL